MTGNQTWVAGYKLDNFGHSVNGAAILTDVSGSVPSNLSQLDIGRYYSGSGYLNGTIANLSFIPKKLSSTEIPAEAQ